jgi:hypothetical protein
MRAWVKSLFIKTTCTQSVFLQHACLGKTPPLLSFRKIFVQLCFNNTNIISLFVLTNGRIPLRILILCDDNVVAPDSQVKQIAESGQSECRC